MYAVTVALQKDKPGTRSNNPILSKLTFFFEAPTEDAARAEVSKRLAGSGWQQVDTPR